MPQTVTLAGSPRFLTTNLDLIEHVGYMRARSLSKRDGEVKVESCTSSASNPLDCLCELRRHWQEDLATPRKFTTAWNLQTSVRPCLASAVASVLILAKSVCCKISSVHFCSQSGVTSAQRSAQSISSFVFGIATSIRSCSGSSSPKA